MKKISFIVRKDEALLQDKIFEVSELYGMKSDNYPFKALKKKIIELGGEIHTQDILNPKDADIIICLDEFKTFKEFEIYNKPSYLIISEPPVYTPENWDIKNHHYFNKIFTYNEDLIINEKYVHYIFSIDFNSHSVFDKVTIESYKKRKLCSLIAGAMQIEKPKNNNNSLLHKRYLIAKWFGKYHSNDIDIYGRNLINDKFKQFKGVRILKKVRFNWLIKLISSKKSKYILNCYKGSIPPLEKLKYQNYYNFSICYDNSAINGCISERIFDCFVSKTVPVYLGAPNINKYIPSNCYIDVNNFKKYADIYDYIKNMSFNEYCSYINAAETFLNSQKINKFTTSHYIKTLISNIEIE